MIVIVRANLVKGGGGGGGGRGEKGHVKILVIYKISNAVFLFQSFFYIRDRQ